MEHFLRLRYLLVQKQHQEFEINPYLNYNTFSLLHLINVVLMKIIVKCQQLMKKLLKKAFADSCRLMGKSDLIDDLTIGLKK